MNTRFTTLGTDVVENGLANIVAVRKGANRVVGLAIIRCSRMTTFDVDLTMVVHRVVARAGTGKSALPISPSSVLTNANLAAPRIRSTGIAVPAAKAAATVAQHRRIVGFSIEILP